MAKQARFIQFSELSQDLRDFIQAGAKIFPIDTFEELPTTKEKEYYRILSGSHKNEVYAWTVETNSYVLIGADDRDIRWDELKSKPLTFPADEHTHTKANITDFPATMTPSAHTHVEADITDLDKYTKLQVDDAITVMGDTKANTAHTHTKANITDFPLTVTPTELATAVSDMGDTKANTVHTHVKDNITDFAHTHASADVTGLQATLNNKVDKVTGKALSANDYTDEDKLKLDSLSESASIDYSEMSGQLTDHKTSNDHDGRYNTKAEITTALSAKAENSTVNGHLSNSTVHVTQLNKDTWSAKADAEHLHTATYEPKNVNIQAHISSTHAPVTAQKNSDITKAEIEAKLTGTIDTHTHASGTPTAHKATHASGGIDALTPADIGAATSGHLHTGTYEPTFTKNAAFNKNFGTTAGTVTQGNDSRLSDARTPVSHNHAAADITQNTTNRFVTDTEKTTWNAKADKTQVLTNVPLNAKFTDTTYSVANTLRTGLMGSYLFYPHPEFERIDAKWVHDDTYNLTVNGSIAKLDVDKADKTQVLTNVPANAKFTDTIVDISGKADAAHTHTLTDVTDSGDLAAVNKNGSTVNYLRGDGTWVTPPNTTYSAMSVAEGKGGTVTTTRGIRADYLKQIIQHYTPSVVTTLPTTSLHAGLVFYKEV